MSLSVKFGTEAGSLPLGVIRKTVFDKFTYICFCDSYSDVCF